MSATNYPVVKVTDLAQGTFCTADQALHLQLLAEHGRGSILVIGDYYASELLIAALANGIRHAEHRRCVAIGDGSLSNLDPAINNFDARMDTNRDYDMWDVALSVQPEVLIVHNPLADEDFYMGIEWRQETKRQLLMGAVVSDVATADSLFRTAREDEVGIPDPLALFDAIVTVNARSKAHEWGRIENITLLDMHGTS